MDSAGVVLAGPGTAEKHQSSKEAIYTTPNYARYDGPRFEQRSSLLLILIDNLDPNQDQLFKMKVCHAVVPVYWTAS